MKESQCRGAVAWFEWSGQSSIADIAAQAWGAGAAKPGAAAERAAMTSIAETIRRSQFSFIAFPGSTITQ